MLTTPDNLLLHVLNGDNQDDLFHLSMDGGATVAWFTESSFLPFLKNGVTLAFCPEVSPVLHDLSKMREHGLAVASASSPSTRGQILSGPIWVVVGVRFV